MTIESKPLEGAVLLPRHLIRANPDQPREYFEPEAMAELAQSIQLYGVRQPLTVRYEPSRYDGTPYLLIGGGRRFLASVGIQDELPAIIENVDAATAQELALIDNLQRSPLLPLEEAKAVRDLMTRDGLSINAIGRRLGKSVGWVNNRLALLKAGEDVQEIAAQKPDAMSSLLLIESVKDSDVRADLLDQVRHDTPFKTIQSKVETHRHTQEQKARASNAPDAQTQERRNAHARGESSSMSRGKRVTGPKKAEVAAEIEKAWATIEAFAPLLPPDDFERLVKDRARRFVRGDLSR